MTSKTENIQPLLIKDCAILNIATGVRAQNLQELRDALVDIHPDSIAYHFWSKKLSPSFEEPEYNNDFAMWAYEKLHDNELAERLSLINPGTFPDIDELRGKLIDVVDLSIRESGSLENSKDNEKFQFTRSQTVLFDKNISITKPEELLDIIDELPIGSIYFHLIDTKLASENLVLWLSQFGDEYSLLTQQITNIDPYFFSLEELRSKFSQIFKDYFKGATN